MAEKKRWLAGNVDSGQQPLDCAEVFYDMVHNVV